MNRKLVTSITVVVFLAVLGVVLTLVTGARPQLGLDLQGGASVVLNAKNNASSATLDQTVEIIRQRIDSLGVAEPEITRQDNSIVVSLPGVTDQDRALAIVGKTAELRFRPVLGRIAENATIAPTTTTTPGATTIAG